MLELEKQILFVAKSLIGYGCIRSKFDNINKFLTCKGPSMEPTIYSEDILITEHISPRLNRISRGDVVIARSPNNPRKHICKRVTGLSGEKIKCGTTTHIVPRGHVWLEGDNAFNSTDSREFGSLPAGLIRGRCVWRIWPLSDLGRLDSLQNWQMERF
ncbi:unnamed protein product, partial [Meganyctiphanes norvegica]